jgi:hypothetical protein
VLNAAGEPFHVLSTVCGVLTNVAGRKYAATRQSLALRASREVVSTSALTVSPSFRLLAPFVLITVSP